MSIKEKELEIIEEFDFYEDWMDKYNYIIELGKELKEFDEDEKNEKNIVNGCNSNVWLVSEKQDGNLYFKADSDALIPKGIAGLIVRIYSGSSPKEIVEHKPIFIKEIGLENHLSPNRANGLASMITKIKQTALQEIQE